MIPDTVIFLIMFSSEKVPGMFGTLVICLPSEHEGGTVKVRHVKQSRKYRSDNSVSSYAC